MPPALPRSAATALPPPRLTARGVGLVAAVWLLYALVYALAVTAFAGVPFAYAFPNQLGYAAIVALASLPPWWLIVRGLAGRGLPTVALAHVVGGAVYTVVVVAAFVAMVRAVGASAFEAIRPNFGWITLGTAFAYVTQFAVYHAIEAGRRGRLRAAQAERSEAAARTQELAALRSQLNPHFLFNALNAISAEVVRDPEEARERIGQLAGLLRYSLDSGRHDLVPLARELAFVRDYLALESARMGPRLRATVEADDRALDALVPPMALQTLVENAVRHGVAPAPGGGAVTVEARADGEAVTVRVADTGVGASRDGLWAGDGVGIPNTDERLRLLVGEGLGVEEGRAEGVAISFRLPLDTAPSGDGLGAAVPAVAP